LAFETVLAAVEAVDAAPMLAGSADSAARAAQVDWTVAPVALVVLRLPG